MNEDGSGKLRRSFRRVEISVDLWEQPEAREVYMLAGWRQWADAGSISSGLPRYVVQSLNARSIGQIHPDGFYLFQIPGTHDLLRPTVKFDRGYPESLETNRNEIFYAGDDQRGLVILIGDEPQLDVERYAASFIHIARSLNVRRVISLGGVYGELPYDRERPVHGIISHPNLRAELKGLSISLSEYHGGASISSYLCKRSGDQGLEMVGLYAFVPTYDFSNSSPAGGVVRIENDFAAWLGVMRRLNRMLGLQMDLTDLENRAIQLRDAMDAKINEIDETSPELGIREYLKKLEDEFDEQPFNPDDEFWEEKLRGLFDPPEDDRDDG